MKKMTSISRILETPTTSTAVKPTASSDNEPKVQVLVRLPASLHAAVKSKAAMNRQSITAVFEDVLTKWVREI